MTDGVLVAALACGGAGRAWQQANGTVQLRAPSEAGIEELRFVLALEHDHSEFLKRFARDPLIGEATRRVRGLRPVRTPTVAHALLRAVCGQLIQARRARAIERSVIRATTPTLAGTPLNAPPDCASLGRLAPVELRRSGLGMRRAATSVGSAARSSSSGSGPARGGGRPLLRERGSARGRSRSSRGPGRATGAVADPGS